MAQRLLAAAAPLLGVSADASGRTAFFDELLEVKADAATLLSTTADLLRQDFKSETLPGRASPSASPPSSSASTRSSRAPTSSPTCEPPPPAASSCCC